MAAGGPDPFSPLPPNIPHLRWTPTDGILEGLAIERERARKRHATAAGLFTAAAVFHVLGLFVFFLFLRIAVESAARRSVLWGEILEAAERQGVLGSLVLVAAFQIGSAAFAAGAGFLVRSGHGTTEGPGLAVLFIVVGATGILASLFLLGLLLGSLNLAGGVLTVTGGVLTSTRGPVSGYWGPPPPRVNP